MTITERDIDVLRVLDRYYVLSRPQIQRLCFPSDTTGRVTRRRLQALVSHDLISRHRVLVHHPFSAPPGSVYYPAKKGCELLAEYVDDERHLLTPTQQPQAHHVPHWLAVSDTHIALDGAIAAQQAVKLAGWINEWDIVNKDESVPEKRFRLYQLIRESPRLICAPDAAFMLTVQGFSKVFYLEQDRNTTGVRQVAARKSPGYAAMAERLLHRKHFPETNVDAFTVLLIAPTDRRRDALKKTFREKPQSHVWKFAAMTDLTPETFLHAPVFHPCAGDPVPLVKSS